MSTNLSESSKQSLLIPLHAVDEFDPKSFLSKVTKAPGVYRMYDIHSAILYVGKAKNLKSRLSSYFLKSGQAIKTQALVKKIANIEITITGSETEALILEQNLIKDLKPPYNILLRDDKSYPYIYLASDKPFPSLSMKRAKTLGKVGRYFGPFPSSGSVRESLTLLEKLFKVRQCQESFYKNRSRPCLQYQIKRCKAPCVGEVSQEEYARDVHYVEMFLQGKSPEILQNMIQQMELESQALNFEKAAELRDQIEHLRHVQENQSAESGRSDLDVVSLVIESGLVVISMLLVRKGRILGHKNYFPKMSLELSRQEMLASFIEQYYVGQAYIRDLPKEVVLSDELEDKLLVENAIYETLEKKVKFSHKVKQAKAQWLKMATANAENALKTHLLDKQQMFQRFDALRELLGFDERPKRMECFDISHSSGEKTVGSCVVFNENGPLKADYRYFNIDGIEAGDDYAAMRQTLERRYRSLKPGDEKWPDLVIIDGGKGQLNLALDVFSGLNLPQLKTLGVAKGATRKPGFETLLLPQADNSLKAIDCDSDNPGLHLIQQIRDEAHRFAITGHRARRDKARRQSQLENIEGVGAKRRKALLQFFGSVANIKTASVLEISKVPGVSEKLAEHIYLSLHSA
ncbi:MAG: excinuclease ABC subunit UvrC [Oleiphilus sp.]